MCLHSVHCACSHYGSSTQQESTPTPCWSSPTTWVLQLHPCSLRFVSLKPSFSNDGSLTQYWNVLTLPSLCSTVAAVWCWLSPGVWRWWCEWHQVPSLLQQCVVESFELLAGVAAAPHTPPCCTGSNYEHSPESMFGQIGCSTRTSLRIMCFPKRNKIIKTDTTNKTDEPCLSQNMKEIDLETLEAWHGNWRYSVQF